VLNKDAVVARAGKTVTGALGRVIPTKKIVPTPKVLSPQEQVDMFLNMPEQALQKIRVQRGDFEYARYVKTMTQMAKEIYG
jgi:hypothetical protein